MAEADGCDVGQIVGGLSIYYRWRLLSTYSHAGMGLGDFYVKEIPEEPRLAFDSDAKLANHEAWWNCSVLAHRGNEGVQSHRWQGSS